MIMYNINQLNEQNKSRKKMIKDLFEEDICANLSNGVCESDRENCVRYNGFCRHSLYFRAFKVEIPDVLKPKQSLLSVGPEAGE